MILMPPKFVAFDLETTGLNNQKDEIIEIGAVKFTVETKGGKVVPKLLGELETFVKPNMMIPAEASAVNHIYDSDVQDAPVVGDAIKNLRKRKGISQKDLAQKCGLSSNSLCSIEKNESFPSKDSMEKICKALDIPVSSEYKMKSVS